MTFGVRLSQTTPVSPNFSGDKLPVLLEEKQMHIYQ